MKVLVLCGSPHKSGTTSYLADQFCDGAKEAGHDMIRFETASMNIHPCLGCGYCLKHDSECVHRDDMSQILPHLLAAEVLVFVSPLYYYGMTAQLKAAVDRFYAVNDALLETSKKVCLISAGADDMEWAFDAIKTNVEIICRYHKWEVGGMVLAFSAESKEDVKDGEYSEAAKDLGREL